MIDLAHHKQELEYRGISKLEGLIAPESVAAARDHILRTASEFGLYNSAQWERSSARFSSAKPFRSAVNALVHSSSFPNLISDRIVELAADLAGEPVTPLAPGQQILFTLPGATTWSVPHDLWHVDAPRSGAPGAPGLQLFTFLDDVGPAGGGTLVIAGSHRLLNHHGRLRSKEIRRRLGAEPYFRKLFNAKRDSVVDLEETKGNAGDVGLQIVELTGRAGDVWFMDLRVLHAPAPNASDTARLMLTCRLPSFPVAEMFQPQPATG